MSGKTGHAKKPSAVKPPQLVVGKELASWQKYFCDESRKSGDADCIALPQNVEEVVGALQEAARHDWKVTVSGARTGITAGAVPNGGLLLSLERMNRVLGLRRNENGDFFVRCEAGVRLGDLHKSLQTGMFVDSNSWDDESKALLSGLREAKLFYPPDPTETSAAIGGTVACNASGAHTFGYGPTRPYVEAMRVILADGSELNLKRGEWLADDDGTFDLETADGRILHGRMPSYPWPKTKSAAGYFSGGRDVMDLFIGSEGTLGIVTEVELRLIPRPERNVMVMCFWRDEATALAFVRALRSERKELGLEAVEYFGADALDMLRERRNRLGAASGVPACLEDDMRHGVFLDIGCSVECERDVLNRLQAIIRDLGENPATCWCATENDTRERLRLFRHALPETVNGLIAEIRRQYPTVTKLGTDMAVPNERLEEYVAMFHEELGKAGLRYVTFGHIGDNHLHVNILPRNPDEYAKGRALYFELAKRVVAMGGSPAAEHGIGKLKTDFLKLLVGEKGVKEMRAVKSLFDPQAMLGAKTLMA
ncbi:MAG: FAD-binding oxidoreductase [Victivallales bacterium]|nr:FAD-binding oxidoreductase [Victivallales bacterium]